MKMWKLLLLVWAILTVWIVLVVWWVLNVVGVVL
jgi:hypothetical protein